MINILPGCLAVASGILLAKILESLFEVRWKQAQDAIAGWVGAK